MNREGIRVCGAGLVAGLFDYRGSKIVAAGWCEVGRLVLGDELRLSREPASDQPAVATVVTATVQAWQQQQ